MVPFVLPRLGLSVGASWQLASGLFLPGGVAVLWQGSRETAALGADETIARPPGAVLRTTASLGALWIAIVLLAAAALGLFASATQGVYAVALLLFLLSAGILFVSLLFVQLAPPAARPGHPADPEDVEPS